MQTINHGKCTNGSITESGFFKSLSKGGARITMSDSFEESPHSATVQCDRPPRNETPR
jgi:hypothetical protein